MKRFLVLLLLLPALGYGQHYRELMMDSVRTPSAPGTGHGKIYARGSTGVYYMYPNGTVVLLGSGSGTGIVTGDAVMDSLNLKVRTAERTWTFEDGVVLGLDGITPGILSLKAGSLGSGTASFFFSGNTSPAIVVPPISGVLALENYFMGRPIDTTNIGIHKVPIIQDDGSWGLVDSAVFMAGGGGGTTSFAALTGNATDNTSLNNELTNKVTKQWAGSADGYILAVYAYSGTSTADYYPVKGDVVVTMHYPDSVSISLKAGVLNATHFQNVVGKGFYGRPYAGTGAMSYLSSGSSALFDAIGTLDTTHGGTSGITARAGLKNLLPTDNRTNGYVLTWDAATGYAKWSSTGAGTVTSVAFVNPAVLFNTPTGSPITSSGTITQTLATQLANKAFMSPDGTSGTPNFRSIAGPDLPWTVMRDTTVAIQNAASYYMPNPFALAGRLLKTFTRSGVIDSVNIGPFTSGTSTDTLPTFAQVRAIIPASSDSSRASFIADSIRGKLGQHTILPSFNDTTNRGAGTSLYFENGKIYTQAAGGSMTRDQIVTAINTGAQAWGMDISFVDTLIFGSNGDYSGVLGLRTDGTYTAYIKPGSLGADRTYTLPDASGTFLLTDGSGANLTGVLKSADSTTSRTYSNFLYPLKTDVRLSADTVVIYAAAVGEGRAVDTAAFRPTYFYAPMYVTGTDTLVVTNLIAVLQGSSPSMTVDVQWHATMGSASATHLITSPPTVTSTTTGDAVTSFNNTKIPPGVWLWFTSPTVTTQGTMAALTLHGYKIKKR